MGGFGGGGFGLGPYGGVASQVSELENRVLDRLEETNPPVFWNLADEIRTSVVEAMNVAMLITGEPQIRAIATTTLAANQVLQSMPVGALALLRIEGPNGVSVKRTTLFDMDKLSPGWETETGDSIDFWFPFGFTQFGVHPKLTAGQQVILTYVAFPVATPRPYTGLEPIIFQEEYTEGFVDYGSHVNRLKEGGNEFQQSIAAYQRFLDKMGELSRFAFRKGSLRFTRTFGSPSLITDVKQR